MLVIYLRTPIMKGSWELIYGVAVKPNVSLIIPSSPIRLFRHSESLEKYARTTGAVVTAEEHSIVGGLGSAVAEILSDCYPVPVRRIGVKDTFTQSGSIDELYKHYGLTMEDIVKAVRHSMSCK